jgi:hypothetical protein
MDSPRIYTYKVTFEEIPHWYWGVHKENKFGEVYWGSPKTNKRVWNLYTPRLQILELFPFTEEGWKEANCVEDRLILPDLNNPLCLNESYGLRMSLAICKDNYVRMRNHPNSADAASKGGIASAGAMNAHPNTKKNRSEVGIKSGRKTGAENGKKAIEKISKPVFCVETSVKYPSAMEASRQTGVAKGNISSCCNKRREVAGGYHWEFVQ